MRGIVGMRSCVKSCISGSLNAGTMRVESTLALFAFHLVHLGAGPSIRALFGMYALGNLVYNIDIYTTYILHYVHLLHRQ